jgi:hypothetical protein
MPTQWTAVAGPAQGVPQLLTGPLAVQVRSETA